MNTIRGLSGTCWAFLALAALLVRVEAASLTWTGAAQDGRWQSNANWSENRVPSSTDTVLIGPGSQIVADSPVLVASLEARSGARISATGAGVDFVVTGTCNVDGASLVALSGAKVRLPGLLEYNGSTGCEDKRWQASGDGSMIDLSSLTNVAFASYSCNGFWIQADGGGRVLLPRLARIANGMMNISVSGRDGFGDSSVVDLSGIRNSGTSVLNLGFNPGGEILLGSLETFSGGSITLTGSVVPNEDGDISLDSLRSFIGSRLTISGNRTVLMPQLTSVDASSFVMTAGARWTLPSAVRTYAGSVGCEDKRWQASGDGSVLDLSSITNVAFAGYSCNGFWIQADGGGQVLLPGVTRIGNGMMNIAASGRDGFGASSVVDLNGIRGSGTSVLNLSFNPGGEILLGNLETLSGGSIALTGNLVPNGDGDITLAKLQTFTGSRLTISGSRTVLMPRLTSVDASSFVMIGGARWALPSAVRTYAGSVGCEDKRWQASGDGSVLDLSSITNVAFAGYSCNGFWIQADGGGQVLLPGVTRIGNGMMNIAASGRDAFGASSFVDLNGIRASGTSVLNLSFNPGGEILLGNLETLSGGSIALTGNVVPNGDGDITLAKLRTFTGSRLTITGNRTVLMPQLTSVDASSFVMIGGARWVLPPAVRTYAGSVGCEDKRWQASGDGSVLDLSSITNVAFAGYSCNGFWIQADGGGQVLLPRVTRIGNGMMNIAASGRDGFGTSSVVDLNGMRSSGTSVLNLSFNPGGEILLGNLETLSGGSIALTGNAVPNGDGDITLPTLRNFTGSRLTITGNRRFLTPSLVSIDASSFVMQAGASWTLPDRISSYRGSVGCEDKRWQASGDGSLLDMTALTSISFASYPCNGFNIQADSGGRVLLPKLTRAGSVVVGLNVGGQGGNGLPSLVDLGSFEDLPQPSTSGINASIGDGGAVLFRTANPPGGVVVSGPGAGNVFAEDADGDGLNYYDELAYGTDPRKADTDGDGYADGVEARAGTNPVDPASYPTSGAPGQLGVRLALELYIPTTVGSVYELQRSEDLELWTDVETIVGDGKALQRFVSTVPRSKVYFRLKPRP